MENLNNQVVSVGDWILTILITAIPIVGFIMLFVWGFGSSTCASKSNWAKAMLVWYLISVGIAIIIGITFGAALLAFYSSDAYM